MRIDRLLRLIGGRCQACGDPLDNEGLTCGSCRAALAPRTAGYCSGCGHLYADALAEPYACGRCRTTPMPWDDFAFYGPYDGLLGDLIREYKFNSRLGLTGLLSSLLFDAAGRAGLRAELLVPVPLHGKRLRERGFNQSLELSRLTAKKLGAGLEPKALGRTRFTTPQVRLKAAERRNNVKGAFAAEPKLVRGKSILLVDDIMTTGGTLLECCKVLKKSGAARVAAIVLARTE